MFSKPKRFVDRVFIHCSASDNPSHDNVATIKDWHVNGNGWNDIGYHYFIQKSGQVEMGRPIEKTPAAQGGNNTGTIAICLHGLDEDKFTPAQFSTLKALAVEINNAYSGALTFHGHREVAAKACPVFDYVSELQLDAFGRLGLPKAAKIGLFNEVAKDPNLLPALNRGSKGPSVMILQKRLMLKDDGIFGPRTERTVKAFQAAIGLPDDGVVDKETWKAILANDRIEHSE